MTDSIILLALLLSLTGQIYSLNNKGLTWSLLAHDYSLNVDRVGCGSCNAYQGDTSCFTKLPILCVSVSSFKRPPYNVNLCGPSCAMTKEFYDGWTEGYFKLTQPIQGISLLNFANMKNICSNQFGSTFTVASHSMGKYIVGMNSINYFHSTWPVASLLSTGGWAARGYGNLNTTSRFWIFINNQPANCWN
jgi:hypothetical protein